MEVKKGDNKIYVGNYTSYLFVIHWFDGSIFAWTLRQENLLEVYVCSHSVESHITSYPSVLFWISFYLLFWMFFSQSWFFWFERSKEKCATVRERVELTFDFVCQVKNLLKFSSKLSVKDIVTCFLGEKGVYIFKIVLSIWEHTWKILVSEWRKAELVMS